MIKITKYLAVIVLSWLSAGCIHQAINKGEVSQNHHEVIVKDLLLTWDECTNTSAIIMNEDDHYLEQELRQLGYMIAPTKSPEIPPISYTEIYVEKIGEGVQLLASLGDSSCTVSRTYLANGQYLTPLSNKSVRR